MGPQGTASDTVRAQAHQPSQRIDGKGLGRGRADGGRAGSPSRWVSASWRPGVRPEAGKCSGVLGVPVPVPPRCPQALPVARSLRVVVKGVEPVGPHGLRVRLRHRAPSAPSRTFSRAIDLDPRPAPGLWQPPFAQHRVPGSPVPGAALAPFPRLRPRRAPLGVQVVSLCRPPAAGMPRRGRTAKGGGAGRGELCSQFLRNRQAASPGGCPVLFPPAVTRAAVLLGCPSGGGGRGALRPPGGEGTVLGPLLMGSLASDEAFLVWKAALWRSRCLPLRLCPSLAGQPFRERGPTRSFLPLLPWPRGQARQRLPVPVPSVAWVLVQVLGPCCVN